MQRTSLRFQEDRVLQGAALAPKPDSRAGHDGGVLVLGLPVEESTAVYSSGRTPACGSHDVSHLSRWTGKWKPLGGQNCSSPGVIRIEGLTVS